MSERKLTKDDMRMGIETLEVLLRQATERNGNLNVELTAMTQERDELRHRVLARIAKQRAAEAKCDELRREVEQLRKESMALVDVAVGENNCAIYHRRQIAPCKGQMVTFEVCRMCVVEWAKQQAAQAAQAGKEGAE